MDINKMKGDHDRHEMAQASTLSSWLLNHIINLSRSRIKATLAGEGIIMNGECITQFDYPLEVGMRITVSESEKNIDFKNRYLRIVYEDRYLVVIERHVGVLSMATGHSSLNVKKVPDDHFRNGRQKYMAHAVYRLDREASDLMIYAKDMTAEQELGHNWHDIMYDHRYMAVASGGMEDDKGAIASWLKDNRVYVTYSSPVDNSGRFAITHFHILDRTTEHSLVEYRLKTGRKDQIRVHSTDIEHPVCEDFRYGNDDNPFDRLCLHAYMLCFTHPVTRRPMELETQIPPAFRKLPK